MRKNFPFKKYIKFGSGENQPYGTHTHIYIYTHKVCFFLSIGRKSAIYLGYIAHNFVNNLWGTGTCRLVAWDAMPLVAPSYMWWNMGKPGVNGDILRDIQPTIVGNMKWNRHRNNCVKLRFFKHIKCHIETKLHRTPEMFGISYNFGKCMKGIETQDQNPRPRLWVTS